MAKDKAASKKINLSVFFPAYNEEGNIEEVITSALKVLNRLPIKMRLSSLMTVARTILERLQMPGQRKTRMSG
jgi:uncharacterized protein YqgV (UPF0045/DUF77 family)